MDERAAQPESDLKDSQRPSSTSPRVAHTRDADVALRALAELAVEPNPRRPLRPGKG